MKINPIKVPSVIVENTHTHLEAQAKFTSEVGKNIISSISNQIKLEENFKNNLNKRKIIHENN